MRILLPSILLGFASISAFADEPATYTIVADGSYRAPGFPDPHPHLLALGGKLVRIVWKDAEATESIPVSVDRITDTRRIPIANTSAIATNGEWIWEWTSPVTRGAATYEIRLKKDGANPVLLEVRNSDEFQDQLKALRSKSWDAIGLDRSELDALSALGFKLKIAAVVGSQGTPLLRVTSNDPAQSRRNITWDQVRHNRVIWRLGAAAGDIDIRAPRWWISAEALATDEGRIRFLDLFSAPPASH